MSYGIRYIIIQISADLFQSESVLDYIVINPYLAILQTPISHYGNALQSLILQIAIYLYYRVQLTDCSILKGVGQIWNWPQHAATGWLTFWPPQAQMPQSPREINENR